MGDVQLVLISLFIAVALLNAAANRLSIPCPIVLVIGAVGGRGRARAGGERRDQKQATTEVELAGRFSNPRFMLELRALIDRNR